MGIVKIKPNLLQGKENFIIGIGVDKYEDNYFPDLKSCKRDIDNFTKVLMEDYQCFNIRNMRKLVNETATKENILSEITSFSLREKASEWNLIIYFAGHGDFEPKRKGEGIGYWIPYDAKNEKRKTYISFEEVKSAISNCDVHHILIICDSCHAGSLFSYFRDFNRNLPKGYTIKSRWGLTSGRKEKVKDGTIKTPSPFSEVLKVFYILFAVFIFCFVFEKVQNYFEKKASERPTELVPISPIQNEVIEPQTIDSLIDVKPIRSKPPSKSNPARIKKIRPLSENDYLKKDTLNDTIVFVGSFENKDNAINIIKELKDIGYEKAEIAMKQNLPYAIVIGGFHLHKNKAKGQVEALRRRGIEAYYAKIDMSEIYRNQK